MDGGQDLVRLGVRLPDLVRNGARTTTCEPATLLAMVGVLAGRADAGGERGAGALAAGAAGRTSRQS